MGGALKTCMDWRLILEFLVILGALAMGARAGGVGLGLWGAVGLLVLVVGFGIAPAAIPGEVLLIVLTVIMAASAMEVAGGIDFLVRVAEKIIRKNPKQVTIVAPLVTYGFTFAAGTGHIVYPLLPVIYEVAHENGIRPERPDGRRDDRFAAGDHREPGLRGDGGDDRAARARTASGWCRFSSSACRPRCSRCSSRRFVQLRVGKELKDDPEYQRLLASGEIEPPAQVIARRRAAAAEDGREGQRVHLPRRRRARRARGHFPASCAPSPARRANRSVSMPIAIAIVMLAVAALILTVTKAPVGDVPKCKTCQSGVTAIIGILGLAWLGDTFINANREVIIGGLSDMAKAAPWTFAIGLFVASMLLYSQAATTRALMPLGLSLGIPAPLLIGMFPAVNGYFFIPNYGTLIAAMQVRPLAGRRASANTCSTIRS